MTINIFFKNTLIHLFVYFIYIKITFILHKNNQNVYSELLTKGNWNVE